MVKSQSITLMHTSDWHLGRALYGRKRLEETQQFLDWLVDEIQTRCIDVLLAAGDIFDNTTPNHLAQKQYYRFLSRMAQSSCRHVVVTAGNHDSPSLINAPKDMLEALDVHVVGHVTDDLEDEVLVLNDESGAPELIVCAVPYLRDRDIRRSLPGESLEDKAHQLKEGIHDHYRRVCELAEKKRKELRLEIPIVAMGHLFAQGGITQDGVRELYVGSLAHVDTGNFPTCIDYLALGHLHRCQRVNKRHDQRYSGSPLAIGFGEAEQAKYVLEVNLSKGSVAVEKLAVPVFQELKQIRGDLDALADQIQELKDQNSRAWLEVIYDGDEIAADLQSELLAQIEDAHLDILRIRNKRLAQRVLNQKNATESLDDLTVEDVFMRHVNTCLPELPQHQRDALMHALREVITSVEEDDSRCR